MFKEEVLKNELENALMKMKEDYPSLFLSLKIKKDEQMNQPFIKSVETMTRGFSAA